MTAFDFARVGPDEVEVQIGASEPTHADTDSDSRVPQGRAFIEFEPRMLAATAWSSI
jgi:hypothetical protein